MTKTPEELAEDHAFNIFAERYESLISEDKHVYAEAVDAFLAGYQAAAPQWISVKDRLPNNDEQVLVFGRGTHELNNRVQPAIRNRCTAEGWAGYDIIDWGGETDDVVNVTHWMPLPKPPEGA
jgi:hypothetical protein